MRPSVYRHSSNTRNHEGGLRHQQELALVLEEREVANIPQAMRDDLEQPDARPRWLVEMGCVAQQVRPLRVHRRRREAMPDNCARDAVVMRCSCPIPAHASPYNRRLRL